MNTTYKTKNQITEGVIWKQLLIFFFPIMVGTLFQQLYNTVDAIIVGRFVGKQALGVCLFVSGSIAGVSLKDQMKDLLPQLGVLLIVLLIITYVPQTVTILPELVG